MFGKEGENFLAYSNHAACMSTQKLFFVLPSLRPPLLQYFTDSKAPGNGTPHSREKAGNAPKQYLNTGIDSRFVHARIIYIKYKFPQ